MIRNWSSFIRLSICHSDHFADHYKLRGGVYFVDSLPTTASGKISRRQVKEVAIALCEARKV